MRHSGSNSFREGNILEISLGKYQDETLFENSASKQGKRARCLD